ncbi:hypothetical protein BaRGS_00018912 [Batillaria attramentaria]|uniref:Uncharacterized protein n=1 Tax=Batillaria attramentaria TaxID=370345 RepID=A0ABD0KRY2_9CAEN
MLTPTVYSAGQSNVRHSWQQPQWMSRLGRCNGKTSSRHLILKKWITQLLKPSRKKTHFGFCFIACDAAIEKDVDGYDRFLHRISQDDDVPFVDASVQLLILPPSGQLRSPEHRWERNLMNINILFIDSVSRQHFFRSLPRTVHFLEKLQSNETSRTSVIDFELVQAVRSRTFETYQTLFEGEIDPSVKPFGTMEFPPEPLGVEHLLKKLKQKGYGTLWLEDLCYQWEWGLSKDLLVHNRSLSREQTWHKFHKALSRAHIDSVEVTYAMCKILIDNGVPDPFHGPDAVCENGRHQHEYFLEYLALYQNVMQMAQQPYFSILVTDAGHEGTGRRIQTLDVALKQYLQQAATQDNTLTVLMSDHGNSYGDFLERSTEGRFELFHPFLIMIVPDGVATSLGKKAMDALHTNQYRLVSVLDLYYTLEAIATDYKNTVSAGHKEYGVTSRGLLDQISPERTCRNIPRIMPNLCICENFDMPVESDEYHGLFAHLAVGRLNNEIQRQFLQTSLPQGVVRAFGHCQHLRLKEFKNVWKSFSKDTLSLKMDLVLEPEHQLFFVSMQAEFASNNANSRIILEKVDRISPYSKFAACADEKVRLQLCICNTNTTKDKVLQTDLPTQEDLDDDVLGLQSEVFVAQNTDNCLLLVQRRCEHGGIFSVVNTCSDRVFHFKFELQTSEMYVSDKVPIEDAVYPGQEIFLCMAIKSSPKAKWGWSFSLRHSVQFL